MIILAYNEARIDTRKRIVFGYAFFFLTTFGLLIVSSLALCIFFVSAFCRLSWYLFALPVRFRNRGERRDWKLCRSLCSCSYFRYCRCLCWRRNSWRFIFHGSSVDSGEIILPFVLIFFNFILAFWISNYKHVNSRSLLGWLLPEL